MISTDIITHRVANQLIITTTQYKIPELVSYFGAMQAQDFSAAKWAIGLRCQDATDMKIEECYNSGEILRTHVLRPTWHFIHANDIKWMLSLTAPRIEQTAKYYYHKLGIDDELLKKSLIIIEKSLQDGSLTRKELINTFAQHRITLDSLGYVYLIGHAELQGLICSGPLKNKEQTFALIEKRAPNAKDLPREEALVELTKRYFMSHGLATIADFAWWSGLTKADVIKAIEMTDTLQHEEINGKMYWFFANASEIKQPIPEIVLLPNYDEYVVGYTDRSDIFDATHISKLDARANPLFQHTILIDGKISGTWKKVMHKGTVHIEPYFFTPVSKDREKVFLQEVEKYMTFLGIKNQTRL